MADVLAAPHLWDLIVSLLPTAVAYLGVEPHLYSVNAFWTRPTDKPLRPDIQEFHRDYDDDRFLAMFVYGTDVLEEVDGPHRFVVGSHLDREEHCGRPATDIYGPAGTVFLADTRAFHLGVRPQRGERLLIWARWCVSPEPWVYAHDKTQPAHLADHYNIDPVTRELVKLVIV